MTTLKKSTPKQKKSATPADIEASAVAHAESRISRISILTELEVGSCESLSRRLAFDDASPTNVNVASRALASVLRKAASRATNRTGFKYEINYGCYEVASCGDKIVVATVTRVA